MEAIAALLTLEWRPGGRLRRQELLRWAYGGSLAFLFAQFWGHNLQGFAGPFLELYVGLQFALVALLTPVYAAGTIADEKARGTLALLLTTSLNAGEIVAFKFLARVGELARLALVGVPLLFFTAAVADLDLVELAALLLATTLPLLPLAALALLASVERRTTRGAVVALYAVWLAVVLLGGGLRWLAPHLPGEFDHILDWFAMGLRLLNPLHVAEPIWQPPLRGELAARLGLAAAAWLALTAAALLLAAGRLRRVCARELGGGRAARRTAPVRPPAGDRPVYWKERHVEGLIPWADRWLPRWAGPLLAGTATMVYLVAGRSNQGDEEMLLQVLMIGGSLVCLMAAVRASAVISGERERHTWDSLMLTPLTVPEVVGDKCRAIRVGFVPYLFAWGVPAAGSVYLWESWEGLFVLALGWPMIWCVADILRGVGIACSASARNSWSSLLRTLLIGPPAALAFILGLLYFLGVTCFGMCLVFFLAEPHLGHTETLGVAIIALLPSAVMIPLTTRVCTPMVVVMAEEHINGHDRTDNPWPGPLPKPPPSNAGTDSPTEPAPPS